VSANFETPFGENGAAQSTKQATDKDGNLLYTDKNGNKTVNSKGVDGKENTKKLAEGKESLQFSYGMGYGKDSDSQSSTTKSGINTQNIIIKDEAEQLKRTGKTVQEEIAAIKTDITTESAPSQSGKLENRFDKDDVQKELDFQREVTEKFGPNVVEAGSLLANKFGEEAKAKRNEAAIALEEAEKAKAENNNETNRALVKQARDNFETASRKAKEWETGGSQRLIIDSALNVISTALAGRPAAEVVASGLSPAVNNQIKKATTDAKGNVNTALNLTAHALWGAVEAYAGNRNVAAGAVGAAGGEVAAKTAKDSVENNSMADDVHPSDERKQNIEMYAKVLFNGDEDKAKEYQEGLELAEAQGQIDSVKETADSVVNLDDTVVSLWEAISNPGKTYNNVVVSLKDWDEAYALALQENPKLAGEMQGYRQGKMKGVSTGGVVLSGAGLAMVEGISKITDIAKSGKLNLSRKGIPNSQIGIQWGKGISNQGKPWEAYVQSKLPDGSINLNDIKPNFKTFDHLLPDGTAISSKTMDTVGSKTYQNPSKITYTLNKYVDDMVNFRNDGKNGVIINNSDIKSKELYLAIPAKTSKEQMKAIDKSIEYARSKGTNIIVNKVN